VGENTFYLVSGSWRSQQGVCLFSPHKEPELLEEVILHQVRGKGNLAHAELSTAFFCKLHALGLQSIQSFQVWAKGVPVKGGEGSVSEEGM